MTERRPISRRSAPRIPVGAAPWSDPLLWVRAAIVLTILLFGPGMLEQFETPKAAVARTLGWGVLAAAVASPRALRLVRWQPLDLAVAGWLAVEVLCTLFSVAPRLSLLGDTEQHEGLLTSVGLAGLYLGARWGMSDPERTRTTFLWAVAATVAAGVYALLQVAGLDPLVWTRNALYETGGTFVRPVGTLGHSNLLGAVTAAMMGFALTHAILVPRGRWWLAAAVLLLGAVTLLTLSRAAWLGAVAGVLVGATLGGIAGAGGAPAQAGGPVRAPARLRIALAIALLVAGAGLAVMSPIGGMLRARVAESFAPSGGSARSRLEIWKAALSCWRARPWLGHGPDTFALVFPRYQTPEYWRFEWGTQPAHAHSIYLHALATRGVVGLAAGACWALALLWAARCAWRASAPGRHLLVPLLAATGALAVAGAFGALGLGGATLVVTASAGVAALAEGHRPDRPRRAGAGLDRRALLAGLATAALAFFWCAGDLLASRAGWLARSEREALAGPAGAQRAIEAANRAIAIRPRDDVLAQVKAETLFFIALASPEPAGPLAEAETAARRATELAPQRSDDWQTLGNVLLLRARLGDSGAQAAFEPTFARCFVLAPQNALIMLQFVRGELALGRPRAALPVAERAVRLYPEAALAQALLGQTRLALGDRAGARQAFGRALTSQWHDEQAGPMLTRALLDSLDALNTRSTDAGQSSRRR